MINYKNVIPRQALKRSCVRIPTVRGIYSFLNMTRGRGYERLLNPSRTMVNAAKEGAKGREAVLNDGRLI